MTAPVKPLGAFGPVGPNPFDLSADELRPLAGALDAGLRRKVGKYLRGGSLVIALMEHTEDVLGGRFGVPGGSGIRTDGTYYWRRDAAEYVETYGIGLDPDVLSHMERADWSAPEVPPADVLQIDSYLARALR